MYYASNVNRNLMLTVHQSLVHRSPTNMRLGTLLIISQFFLVS